MKTDATELAHCIVEAVRRHALARPDVGFAIWHEGKLVEQWRAPSCPARAMWRRVQDALARRLSDVLGEDFVSQSVAVPAPRGAPSPSPAAPACPMPRRVPTTSTAT